MSLQVMTPDASPLWIQVCEQLKWHNKGADECIGTLNRLWRKHPAVTSQAGEPLLQVPVLTEKMLDVKLEHWSLDHLVALNPPHERDQPQFFPPIVVLHWFQRDFLVDGNTRVNLWRKRNNVGPHAVLRIVERK